MSKRRRYTDEERATAVLFLESEGYFEGNTGALSRVAQRLSIPHQTLSRWARQQQNPPPPELVQEKRSTLLEMLRDEAYAIFGDMGMTRADADYRTLGTVLGIVIDKLQLLEGKPTERVENIDGLTDDERAARLAAILDAARARRNGQPH